ncbi:LEAF RUST 10 DISEASE-RESISTANCEUS RECEPTOR-LIKE PROTEIN KINASE-like 1.4 [Primulina huaijiensis]|uniref:LEAF RUST 10 DISEASE-RESISTANCEUS RECEPTOR-LIKE PROTEIN KINASE-like 1.4 n=1 Tax=Primulina huaijiensis TaxID=1492673 RepID=UPI003CC755F7
MSKGKPMFFILTILILLWFPAGIRSHNSSSCVSSSCGEISISYPFRLATDPPNCGHPDPIFKLQCLQNRTILQSDSAKYVVRSISYNNFSIRVSDLGIVEKNYSSCPAYSSNALETRYLSAGFSNTDILFVNCLKPVSNRLYVEDPVCGNPTAFSNSSRVYSYLVVGWTMDSETTEFCREDRRTLVSSDTLIDNRNYTIIHDSMAYGMELIWFRAYCGECDRSDGRCSLEDNKIRCRHYCYEDTPFSERTFGCKLEYYGALIFVVGVGIASLLGLRFILGVVFIIGFLLCKRRKQRSTMDKSGAIEHRSSDPESSKLELEKR